MSDARGRAQMPNYLAHVVGGDDQPEMNHLPITTRIARKRPARAGLCYRRGGHCLIVTSEPNSEALSAAFVSSACVEACRAAWRPGFGSRRTGGQDLCQPRVDERRVSVGVEEGGVKSRMGLRSQ